MKTMENNKIKVLIKTVIFLIVIIILENLHGE